MQWVYLGMDMLCAVVSVYCLRQEIGFDVTYKLRQMTFLISTPTFKMYVFCIPDGQTKGQTDGEINLVWAG